MTIASTTTTSGAAALMVNGLVSGITTPAVITALLKAYKTPISDLQKQQDNLEAQAADYRALSTSFQSVLAAAQALSTKGSWDLAAATSSDSSVATAIAAPGAQTGSLTFTVDQLAQASVLASKNAVSSEGQVVTTAPSLFVATGAAGIGFSALNASTGLALGSYTVAVTQSSAAAAITGSTPLASSVTISTTDNILQVTVDGTTRTLTIASGSYTPTGLATAVNAAATAAGAPLSASVTSAGTIQLATKRQGSSATIKVTGGTALGALHLASGLAGVGTDAVVTVNGAKTTLASITAGGVITLAAPSTQTIDATVAQAPTKSGALIASGTAHAANVSTGDGSLSQVVAAINASGLAATASATKLSSGDYILQISSNDTGAAGAVTVGSGAFTGTPLGGLDTIAQAETATVSIGGANGYTLSSSTNTFTGLLTGTSVTAVSTGTATVTVAQDPTGEATRVSRLVTAVNKALKLISTLAGYTTSTKTAGPLMGASVVTNVKDQLQSIFATAVGASSIGNLADVGITLTRTGNVSFTKSKFVTAFNTDPSQVTALFTQGGTYAPSAAGAPGEVTFALAGSSTVAGTYAIKISHSATQATDTGNTLSTGAVSVAETLTITTGSSSATYTTTAGESLTDVAAGINQALASTGLGLTASVVHGTQLVLTSDAYGSNASFSVTSTASGTGTTGLGGATAGVAKAESGTNVVGTIGGVAATGNGQMLTAPQGNPLDGLAVIVSATGIASTTTLGTLTYSPGAAQRLVTAAAAATNPATGSMTSAIKSLTTEATRLNPEITMYTKLEASQRSVLQQEFDNMETRLGTIQNESSMLAHQLSALG